MPNIITNHAITYTISIWDQIGEVDIEQGWPLNATLGARDFSSAVSGFSQVFIVARSCRPSANTENPAAREKNLWCPG